ncbi:MAG: AAA family ATPase, partial [Candidatus Gracilibacteria bacterium]|nr:AAA family ATPase [Candidatus Gracilibacteria bacterium]
MIESSNNNVNRVITPHEKEIDKAIDTTVSKNILRPKQLSDYVLQDMIKRHLSVSISSAKIRGNSLEHVLFYGPPGLGKTTISSIIASEMGTNMKSTSGPA